MTVDQLRERYPFLGGPGFTHLDNMAKSTEGESRIFLTADSMVLYITLTALAGACVEGLKDIQTQKCLCATCRDFIAAFERMMGLKLEELREYVAEHGPVH